MVTYIKEIVTNRGDMEDAVVKTGHQEVTISGAFWQAFGGWL